MNALIWIAGILEFLLILANPTIAVVSGTNTNLESLSSKVNSFKVNLHHVLEGSRVREKRQIQGSYDSVEHQIRVKKAASYDLPYLDDYKLTFWTPVEFYSQHQVLVGTQEGHLILFGISEEDDRYARIIAASYEEEVATKAKAFTHFDEQWFIVLQSTRNQTSIRLYLKEGRGLEQRQAITFAGESDFDLVTVKGIHYLVVTTFQSSTNEASLLVYHWKGTQFDLIASRTVYGPRSIACWELDGTLYIVLAQRVEGASGEFRFGSPVYLYNAKDDRGLVLQQMLSIEGPVKVLHFYVSSNHYIIFIGPWNAAVYWWANNQFLLWQRIEGTAYATDAEILVLENGEVMIVIALKEEVLFATLDSSGHYIISSVFSFAGYSLSSFQFMYSGRAYYALALFAASQYQKAEPIWKLTLEPYYLPSGSSLDSLRQCLKDMSEILEGRQEQLNNLHDDLSRVWLRNREQKITAEVFVAGNTTSNQKSLVSEILIVTERKTPPESSLSEVDASVVGLKSLLSNIQQNVMGSVRKSIQQNITGTLHFRDALSIPSLNLQSASVSVPINGVPVSRIDQYSLRSVGDQTFTKPVQISHIDSHFVSTKYINGIDENELLLLENEQDVTGQLTFNHIQAADLFAVTVNSIPVENLVTASSEQTISDLKSISHLHSLVINVHGQTNGEILREINPKIIRSHTNDVIKEHVALTNVVHVTGDIFLAGLINGVIDLSQLLDRSVTKHTQQDLTGIFTFESTVIVNDGLFINGYVNNVNLSNLLTLSTNQIVKGHMVFGTLTVLNNLSVDTINDMRLREEAVLKTTDSQFVTGVKKFAQTMNVDFIDMTEYVTLDEVDPSLFVQDIVKHKEGVVKQDHTVFHNAVVLGNLTAIEGINGIDINDLFNNVWLKTIEQVIEVPVNVKTVAVQDDMEVKIVNKINLDTDLVHSFGEETVISVKHFEHNVIVSHDINTIGETTMNGMNIVSVKTELDDYVEEGTVHGKKILNQLEIHGNLDATMLNNFDFKDIMRPHDYQEVSAPIVFPSELTIIPDSFQSGVVWFNRFNTMDLRYFLSDTVSQTNPVKAIKNKVFSDLQAVDLYVPEENAINSIPISWLTGRVVTLNTPQKVWSDKSFINSLHLKGSTVTSLNGKDFKSLIEEVVFTDSKEQVSDKEFIGSFKTQDIFIHKPINGIDISNMSQNIFLKSENNEIKSPIQLVNGVEIGNLITDSTIDGVAWNNLIFTKKDEVLEQAWLMTDTNLHADAFVKGLVNDCDLLQLEQNALYSNKSSQLIQEQVTIESIEVIGNIHFEDAVNEVAVQDLFKKLILVTGDQVVESDLVLETGTEVTNLNIGETVDLNLGFIMNDAVRNSLPQSIHGIKKFKDLTTNLLKASNLVVNRHLNTVDVNGLYNSIVWKGDDQIIDGEKIFDSLQTHVAVVEGHLNGLSLPNDIVKTDTSEHIKSPIIFMSDSILVSDLSVGGRIDGVIISRLAQELITLSTNQNVISSLSFLSDTAIHDDLIIDGTINDIVLEMVAKTKNNFPLGGYKVFIQDFVVQGSLNVSSVNGYDIKLLEEDILKKNGEEFINALQGYVKHLAYSPLAHDLVETAMVSEDMLYRIWQEFDYRFDICRGYYSVSEVFQKPFKAKSHLFADWINSIPLSEITSTFFGLLNNFHKTLSYLEELSYEFLHQITGQMNAVGNRVSRFAYFVLIQEINLGPSMKILHGHRVENSKSEFSHSVVIWTSQKHCSYLEKCCHEQFSQWLRIKKSGRLMIDGNPQPGRIYPIHNPAPVTTDKDFFIWTNATSFQPKWCDYKEGRMTLVSGSDLKKLEVFLDIWSSPSLSEVKTFKEKHLYAVAGFYYDRRGDIYSSAAVYAFNEVKRNWSEHQILPSYGVLSLDITYHYGNEGQYFLLAVGTGMGSFSTVYKWDIVEHEFSVLQSIPTHYVTSVLWMKHGSTLLLAMANVENWPSREDFCSDAISGGEINIYTFDEKLTWRQSIPLEGVISLIHFNLEGDIFLVAASSKLQTIYIYEFRGYAGFSLIQSVFVGEVTHLNTYTISDDIYLTVATASGPVKILKVFLQGRHTVTEPLKDVFPEYQKDEAETEKLGC